MLRFESDIAIIRFDSSDHVKELREMTARLTRMTATGELKGIVVDLQGKDRLEFDLVRELDYLVIIRQRSRTYHSRTDHHGFDHRRHIRRRDLGKPWFLVLCDPSPNGVARDASLDRRESFPSFDSVENGIAWILNRHDVFPGRTEVSPALPPGGHGRLFAVGCSEKDLGDIPAQLRESGFEVVDSATDSVADGDHVIFCVSCASGPTEGTNRSYLRCSGREIVPVCIVCNFSDVVEHESLIELVAMETMEILSEILPKDVVESLPQFYDFDLNLTEKINDRLNEKLQAFRCK